MSTIGREELIEKTCQYLQELQKGNEDTFTELYHVTSGYLYLLLQKWGVDKADQQDVLQEIYCNVSQSISSLEHPQAGLAWIMSIAKHKSLDYLRKKYKEKERFVYLDSAEQENEKNQELENDIFELPEDVMENKETQQILRTFIQELPENQRKVLEARFFHDMSINEMAVAFDMNPNTVKTNLSRAKAGVKEKVESYQRTTGIKLRSVSIIPVLYVLLENEIQQAFAQTRSMQSLIEQQWKHSVLGQIGSGAENAVKIGKTVASTIKARVLVVALVLTLLGGAAAVKKYHDSNNDSTDKQIVENTLDGSESGNEEMIETPEPTIAPTQVPKDLATTSQFYYGTPTNVEKQEDGTYILSFDNGVEESYTITKEEYKKMKKGCTLNYDNRKLYCIHKDGGDYWFVDEADKDTKWREISEWTQLYLVSDRYQYGDDMVVMRYRYEADNRMDALVSCSQWQEKDRLVVSGSAMLYYTDKSPNAVLVEKEHLKATTLEEFFESKKKGIGKEFDQYIADLYGFDMSTDEEENSSWKNLGLVFVKVSENGVVEIHECLAFADGDIWAWALEEFYPDYYFD